MNSLKKHAQQGFTIVELLIVIVVIGILAALVITTYNGIQQKGRNTERQTDLKAIQGQVEAYYAQNGRYPTGANLSAANAEAFISAEMKGLSKEALRDPKGAAGVFGLATAAAPNVYAYIPSPTGCDNTTAGGDCDGYVLQATPEPSSDPLIVMESSN